MYIFISESNYVNLKQFKEKLNKKIFKFEVELRNLRKIDRSHKISRPWNILFSIKTYK